MTYQPSDEVIPYDPKQRETQAIQVNRKTPTSDSGLLRAVKAAYLPFNKSDNDDLVVDIYDGAILLESTLSHEEALKIFRSLENYKKSKQGESKWHHNHKNYQMNKLLNF